MKRLFILFMVLVLSTGVLFAETARTITDAPFVDWKFSPAVSSYAGYNLDLGTIGLSGSAGLEVIVSLWDNSDSIPSRTRSNRGKSLEFSGDSKPYGYIKIEDLLIEATSGVSQGESYDSRAAVVAGEAGVLRLKWGSILGSIFIGPVYINLAHDYHGDQGTLVNNILGDLDSNPYTVLTYSVIDLKDTASYVGARAEGDNTIAEGAYELLYRGITDSTSPGASLDGVSGSNNAISVGFKVDDLLDIRIGVASGVSYKDFATLYPIQASLYFELLAVENLSLKLRTTITANNGSIGSETPNAILEEGNPLVVGFEVGYTLPMGDFNLTPALGAELQVENSVAKYGGPIALDGATTLTPNADVGTVSNLAYEIGFGLAFDWRGSGVYRQESDYLDAPDKDVEATDGVSLGFAYGVLPHSFFRGLNVSYLGAKIALWDSESGSDIGILPGVKAGLVLDFNYALGGTYDVAATDLVNNGSGTFTLGARADLGALVEIAVPLAFVTPYVKASIRVLDLLQGADSFTVDATDYTRASLLNTTDIRLKVGADIPNLVPNTLFQIWWESGDLLVDGTIAKDASYNGANRFYTNLGAVGSVSAAQLGFIAVGAEVSY